MRRLFFVLLACAFTLPVFAQAKAAAKKTQCLSGTKQLGLGFHMYVNDFDDMLPYTGDNPEGGDFWAWYPSENCNNTNVVCPLGCSHKILVPLNDAGTRTRASIEQSLRAHLVSSSECTAAIVCPLDEKCDHGRVRVCDMAKHRLVHQRMQGRIEAGQAGEVCHQPLIIGEEAPI